MTAHKQISFNFFRVQCPCVPVKKGSTCTCKPSLKETRGLLPTCRVSLALYLSEPFGKEPIAIMNNMKIEVF